MDRYWEERAIASIKRMEKQVNDYIPVLTQSFEIAKKDLQKEINAFYGRYAIENKISFAEAQTLLNFKELQEFKGNLKAYKELSIKSIGTYNLELNNLSTKARITRLQALQFECDTILQRLYQEQKSSIENVAREVYKQSYYNSLFDVEQYTGFQFAFSKVADANIYKILEQPVQGSNLSTRLWRQDLDTGFKIRQTLNNMFTTGKPPQDFAKELQKIIGVRNAEGNLTGKKYEAYRVLYNESSNATNQANLQAYKDDGIEEYEICSVLDSHTSQICREQDGKHYPIEKAVTGENFPSFHVNCRTTTVPYIAGLDIKSTRMARGVNGKSIRVKDKTYDNWLNSKIEQHGADKVLTADKMIQNESSDFRQYEKYKTILGNNSPKSFAKFQELKYNNSNEYSSLKQQFNYKKKQEKLLISAQELNIKGKALVEFDRVDIKEFKYANQHINKDRTHNTNKSDAKHFIESAEIAFKRWDGDVMVYVSMDGCSVVNIKDKIVSTAYKSEEYDDKFKKLMEVVKDGKMSDSK